MHAKGSLMATTTTTTSFDATKVFCFSQTPKASNSNRRSQIVPQETLQVSSHRHMTEQDRQVTFSNIDQFCCLALKVCSLAVGYPMLKLSKGPFFWVVNCLQPVRMTYLDIVLRERSPSVLGKHQLSLLRSCLTWG